MRSSLFLLAFAGLLAAVAPPPAGAQSCVSGTVTAAFDADPAHPYMWKYCVDVRWDLGRFELSHLDVFLQLPNCDCICDPRFIQFASPAGHSVNTSYPGETCELDYYGVYVCKGDPSLPAEYNGPAVKFQPDPASACAPGLQGYGTFCFFSPMPPQDPSDYPQDLAIKHGREVCYGMLSGQLPGCDCALPTKTTTWGSLKATYR
jgi:hypothetical protein